MFEVGKLSDESLDSLLLELEKVRTKVRTIMFVRTLYCKSCWYTWVSLAEQNFKIEGTLLDV